MYDGASAIVLSRADCDPSDVTPHLQGTFTNVRFPQKGTVFDYYVNFKAAKFAPW